MYNGEVGAHRALWRACLHTIERKRRLDVSGKAWTSCVTAGRNYKADTRNYNVLRCITAKCPERFWLDRAFQEEDAKTLKRRRFENPQGGGLEGEENNVYTS